MVIQIRNQLREIPWNENVMSIAKQTEISMKHAEEWNNDASDRIK